MLGGNLGSLLYGDVSMMIYEDPLLVLIYFTTRQIWSHMHNNEKN